MTRMLTVRPRLDWFVDQMRAKLALSQNQAKADWRAESELDLMVALEGELRELRQALINGEPAAQVVGECADVANRAMMLADRVWTKSAIPVRPGPSWPPPDVRGNA